MVITVARTARIVRFVRASAVVKASSKVNWYYIPQLLDYWYWQIFNFFCCRSSRVRKGTPNDTDSTSTNKKSVQRNGFFFRSSSSFSNLFGSTRSRSNRHQIEARRSNRGRSNPLRFFESFFVTFRDDEEERRIESATIIQRAWRQRYYGLTGVFHNLGAAAQKRKNDAENAMERNSDAQQSFHTRSVYNRRRAAKSRASNTSTISAQSDITAEPRKRKTESQVGNAMREITGYRVALGIMVALFLTVLFDFSPKRFSLQSTMIVLHSLTANNTFSNFTNETLDAARATTASNLYEFTFSDGTVVDYPLETGTVDDLRDREKLKVTICTANDVNGDDISFAKCGDPKTIGMFDMNKRVKDLALVSSVMTLLIVIIFLAGVTAFAGPVMTLVVLPIQRMVRLLGMLMKDPLGYQSSQKYHAFVMEEDELTKNTKWTKEVLKGMET